MQSKRGISVSLGVALGPALIVDADACRVPPRHLPSAGTDVERDRLHQAIQDAAKEAQANQEVITSKLGSQYGAIFGAHALLLKDPTLAREVELLIESQLITAEYAVSRVIRKLAKQLESIEHGHFSTRAADLYDLEKLVLRHLLGHRQELLSDVDEPVIVLAHDLTPSETAAMDTKKVMGFATEAGGRASHTAIMAGALGIPAVVGIGKFLSDISSGDWVVVDGAHGVLILHPDATTIDHYENSRRSYRSFESKLEELRDVPAITKDGTQIALLCNIEFPPEAALAIERGADGVGLYRTEFLYLGSQSDPSEAEHVAAYEKVTELMRGKPVVIRTLDLGADKFSSHPELRADERNPSLGLRSVRLCLRNLGLFKTQLRAILKASARGDVRIMFPMVSTVLELRQCKMVLAEVKEDLEEEGVAFQRKIPVGTMIEVPSAAIMAEFLAREVDFFSIGTNDLVQYTLAADRTNEAVASLYTPGDPAVLRLIDHVVTSAAPHGVAVNVCGEMSGDPIYTMLLIGLGLRQLSMAPHHLLEIKKIVRGVTLDEAKQVARGALGLETARDVNNYLREHTRRILPEVID